MWIYQRVDLLYFGYCLHLDTVCGSTRVDLLCFGHCPYLGADTIVVQTLWISVCRHFVLFDIKRITGKGHFLLSNIEQITGYRYLCVSGDRMDHRTDCWIQRTNLTVSYMDIIVDSSDWFCCCIIIIESTPVDCNHYFIC